MDSSAISLKSFPAVRKTGVDLEPILKKAIGDAFLFCKKRNLSLTGEDYRKVLLYSFLFALKPVTQQKSEYEKALVFCKKRRNPTTHKVWQGIYKVVLPILPDLFNIKHVVEPQNWEDPELETALQGKEIKGNPKIVQWLRKQKVIND